jgi:hypothetical protein
LLILISSNAFKALLRGHSRGAFKAKSLLPTLLSLCPAWHRQLGYICWLAVVRKHTLAAAATPLSGQVAQRVCSQMRQLMLLDGGKQTTHKHTHTLCGGMTTGFGRDNCPGDRFHSLKLRRRQARRWVAKSAPPAVSHLLSKLCTTSTEFGGRRRR